MSGDETNISSDQETSKKKPRSIRNHFNKMISYGQAFQQDCETLLVNFAKQKVYDFKTFSMSWKEFNFSLVFCGEYASCELGHFTSLLFHCAKKYVLLSSNKFIQIGGLYILYGLFYKQPIRYLAKIRLLAAEFKTFQCLIEEMHTIKQFDAVYVFHKLLCDDAFEFTISQKHMSLNMPYVELELINDIFPLERSDIKAAIIEETKEAMNEVYKVDDEYQSKLKEYISEKNVNIETYSLSLREDVDTILSTELTDPSTSSNTGSNIKRKIIEQSFKRTVDPHFRMQKKPDNLEKLSEV